jgi:putative zinc finger/helix-turn-helix YgiT family protein
MRKADKKNCPICGNISIWEEITERTNIEVRGETFNVKDHYYRCSECGEEFEDFIDPIDPLDEAYRKYREKHGFLQPEEIKGLRKKYALTQIELSSLLGLGEVTISRWENGALQEESNDIYLRLAMNPRSLLKLISESPEFIPDVNKRYKIIRQLESEIKSEECPVTSAKRSRLKLSNDMISGWSEQKDWAYAA